MNANVELFNDPNGPPSCLQVDIAFYRLPMKLWEGNVFSRVCQHGPH